MADNLTVRRARLDDIDGIGTCVQRAMQSDIAVDSAVITEWLFGKGVWVALQEDTLVGVAAWQAENLVSVTDVFHIAPTPFWTKIGATLLETIEAEAITLMCEVSAVLLSNGIDPSVRSFLRDQGYKEAELEELHRFWQEVLAEFLEAEVAIMIKQLRDRMVMVPR
jgi:N-acetylglutamate synthase-like GNAT family acetyltransferase